MSQGNEIEEIYTRASGAVAAMISAAGQLAVALIELRIQRLREAAARDREQVTRVREQMRTHQRADSAVWRAAMRPQWWRQAGAEDITRVWRAASTWQHVDPRAAEAREVVVERLAERGVRVDPAAQSAPSPQDVAWLSDALDQAAADRAARATAESDAVRAASPDDVDEQAPTVIDGEVGAPRARPPSAREREQQAAGHVRAVWSGERAERVLACKAWPALAHQLGQLQEQGHDVGKLLRGVDAFVDRAHTPAAFAFRSIDDRLDGLVDLGTQRSTSGGDAPAVNEPTEAEVDAIFGPEVPSPLETEGRQLAGDATAEQVQAAGLAYWREQHAAAQAVAATNPAPEPNGYRHAAADREHITRQKMKGYQSDDMTPYWYLGRENEADRRGIVAKLQEATIGEAPAAAGPAAHAEQSTGRSAPGVAGGPVGAAAVGEQGQPPAHGAVAAAEAGDGWAAQIAAQAYPISTREAVAAAAEKGGPGADAGAAGGRAVAQPVREEPPSR